MKKDTRCFHRGGGHIKKKTQRDSHFSQLTLQASGCGSASRFSLPERRKRTLLMNSDCTRFSIHFFSHFLHLLHAKISTTRMNIIKATDNKTVFVLTWVSVSKVLAELLPAAFCVINISLSSVLEYDFPIFPTNKNHC